MASGKNQFESFDTHVGDIESYLERLEMHFLANDIADCHAKIGPPKNRSGRTDFGKKTCQNQSGQTNFGSQNWSPFANFGPPSLLFPIQHYRAISPRDLHRKL